MRLSLQLRITTDNIVRTVVLEAALITQDARTILTQNAQRIGVNT